MARRAKHTLIALSVAALGLLSLLLGAAILTAVLVYGQPAQQHQSGECCMAKGRETHCLPCRPTRPV